MAWKRISVACLALAIVVTAAVLSASRSTDAAAPEARKSPRGAEAAATVRHFGEAEKVEFSWGWIRWLINAETDPEAEMTFGIVHVDARQKNPRHTHPNSAEYLHVVSGSCRHLVGNEWVVLKAGDTIRIPPNVPHMAETLDEPMRAVIVYNTGNRKMVLVDGKE